MTQLKEAFYQSWGPIGRSHPELSVVKYIGIDNCYYFTGINETHLCTSTINVAESIIESIAKKEKIDLSERFGTRFQFVDVQTYMMYKRRLPGEYDADQLVVTIAEGIQVYEWHPIELPQKVTDAFATYIGADLKSMYADVMHKSNGFYCVAELGENGEPCYFYVRPDGTPIAEGKYFNLTNFGENGFAWMYDCEKRQWIQMYTDGKLGECVSSKNCLIHPPL